MYAMQLENPSELLDLVGRREVYSYNGREIELVDVSEWFAIVKDVESGGQWKVLWADLFVPNEELR